MRLTPEEIAAIKAAARDAFGEGVVVRLFGSRLDDDRRGGDIDLHVEVPVPDTARQREIGFRVMLADALDEHPLNVVVHPAGSDLRWIDRMALRDGCVL